MYGDQVGEVVEGGGGSESTRFLVISLLQTLVQLPSGLNDSSRDSAFDSALSVLQDRLGLSGVYLLGTRCRSGLAAGGIPAEVEDILFEGEATGESLLGRVSREQRIFLLGRRSTEPCMNRIRQLDLDWQAVALVPLRPASGASVILVLAASDGTLLSPEILATLHPVFRFIAGSLNLSDAGEPSPEGAMPGVEDLEVELEALRSRNTEVEDLLRVAGEATAAGEAGMRLEIEDARVQIAELETSLASATAKPAEVPCEDCMVLRRKAAANELRMQTLEQDLAELRLLADVAEVASVAIDAPANKVALSPVIALEDEPVEAVALGAMAEAAVAELASVAEPERMDPPDELPGPVLVPEAAKVAGAPEPWVLCCAEGSRPMFEELARFAGDQAMPIFSSEDLEISPGRRLLLVNLLVDDPAELVAAMEESHLDLRLLAYAARGKSGAALGEIGWLASSLPAEEALAEIRNHHGLPERTLLVSARLREMAPLREALTNEGSSVAMACDARQALDLLEIVQQPDAVILDLAVEGAVTLALAARLYRENPSTGLQIFLLAPEKSRLPEFRADTAWAEVLRPFGIPDLQRLIAPWARLP